MGYINYKKQQNNLIPLLMSTIDVSSVQWTKLTVTEFSALEAKMQEQHRLTKSKKQRMNGIVIVTLHEKKYQVKELVASKLKLMKSEKSKQKLIDEIISTHTPITEL